MMNNFFKELLIDLTGQNKSLSLEQQIITNTNAPYQLPTDDEVFLYSEHEKNRKKELKNLQNNQKIWDKMTFSTNKPLNQFKSTGDQLDQTSKIKPKKDYSSKQKTLINTALEIANQRQKNKDKDSKSETIFDLIEQKKEMFLVTMSHGIIEDEIEKIKKNAKEKQEALIQSESMLEKDSKYFSSFLEANKTSSEGAQLKAEMETKKKKERENDIKAQNIILTSLKSEKSRYEEQVASYKEHKSFLDKAIPQTQKEYLDLRSMRRKEVINKALSQFLHKIEQMDEKSQQIYLSNLDKSNQNSATRQKNHSVVHKRNLDSNTKRQLEEYFNDQIKKGKIQEVSDFDDDYEMYFTHPDQLIEVFSALEEKNLVLIQNTQQVEQQFEAQRSKYNKDVQEMEKKTKSLNSSLDSLKRQYEDLNQKIIALDFKKQNYGIDKAQETIQGPIRVKLIDLISQFKEKIGDANDLNTKDNLQLLQMIELYLNDLLKQFNKLNQNLEKKEEIEKFRIKEQKERKKKENEEREIEKNMILEAKNKKNREKMEQPTNIRIGRMIMTRSDPMDKKVVEVKVVIDQDAEDEKRYFTEDK